MYSDEFKLKFPKPSGVKLKHFQAKPSHAELGHFNSCAETEVTICSMYVHRLYKSGPALTHLCYEKSILEQIKLQFNSSLVYKIIFCAIANEHKKMVLPSLNSHAVLK